MADVDIDQLDPVTRMRTALRMLGWSAHSGSPRIGPKAAIARWGLGLGPLPEGEASHALVSAATTMRLGLEVE
jgi:hypothetical protein